MYCLNNAKLHTMLFVFGVRVMSQCKTMRNSPLMLHYVYIL